MKESGLRIRVDDQLRGAFIHACKKSDLTAAQVLRAFMRNYVEQYARGEQSDLFVQELSSNQTTFRNQK